jgi:Tfp pilus assembly protein PilO
MLSKANLIIAGIMTILVVLLISVFFMWRNTVTQLDAVKAELQTAQRTITVLQSENAKLVQYNLERDKQIKDIEKKYQNNLKNIPADKCGDMKPSAELLEYLRTL